jgi:hypothetical protein
MPYVRFEPTIPVFERAKAVHVLDRAATVIGGKETQRVTNYIPLFSFSVRSLTVEVKIHDFFSSALD